MRISPRAIATAGVLVGSIVLALEPLLWLIGTWHAPGYDSLGWPVCALVVALFLWSVSSPRTGQRPTATSALWLLLCAAAVRLMSQLLAVNVIGALALAVDVYALGLLAGLEHRRRPLAPLWLAVGFTFSLPLEPLLQRLLGFPLQHLSAAGACSLLQHAHVGVQCEGTRILLGGRDVLVDLPCSGAQLLSHALLTFALLAALKRPGWRAAALGGSIAVAAAWLGNSLRIAALSVGTAFPAWVGGADLTVAPWHDLVGLCFTGLTAAAVYAWALRVTPRVPGRRPPSVQPMSAPTSRTTAWRVCAGLGYAAAASIIVSLAPRPVDVSSPSQAAELPLVLAGAPREPQPLSSREQSYFTQYGGTAVRARYGQFALVAAGTRSPLRHLHGPEVCLEGAGHDVQYLGPGAGGLPTAVYRTRDGQGGDWRIRVSWISADGHTAASVPEAIWYWLTEAVSSWIMVQRITPWGADPAAAEEFEAGVLRAFNLPSAAIGGHPGATS